MTTASPLSARAMRSALPAALVVAALTTREVCPQVDTGFEPRIIAAHTDVTAVRPGDGVAVTLVFRNAGAAAAARDYWTFLHFEHPNRACENIVFQADHPPRQPTTAWAPGLEVTDGPRLVTVPADAPDGTYFIHAGLWDQAGTGRRLCDAYLGELTVSRAAPEHVPRMPPMPPADVEKRRAALAARIGDGASLETDAFRFTISRTSGAHQLLDKRTDVLWASATDTARLGWVTLRRGEQRLTVPLSKPDSVRVTPQRIDWLSRPVAPDGADGPLVGVYFGLVDEPPGLSIRVGLAEETDWQIESSRLPDDAFWTTDADDGYLAIPHRLGLLLEAETARPDDREWRAYANAGAYSMAFVGVRKQGAALLIAWDDPYVTLGTRSEWLDDPLVGGSRRLSVSLSLSHGVDACTIHPLGQGGYVEVAAAYRALARQRGYLKTWDEKERETPAVRRMHGAADFKPFVFTRTLPRTRWNETDRERLNVAYTFDEAARVAEHLAHDLMIERAMFVLAGWIRRGYDNQHPDILPAAPECGGDEGLIECARRVSQVGYLFGLHDNYQDMYRDAASWDESYIMRRPDGRLHEGGVWAGGQAYLTCSQRALELARRDPRNLPAVKRRYAPGIYFIDTTFAAPPYECFAGDHPLSKRDDIKWKAELCDYARSLFGLFGSEEGQEWAVPHADYFEGLMSHKVAGGKDVIPLFELVYGDCINLYTHQGDRARPDRPEYILAHLLYGEMPVYQFGPHLYWQQERAGLKLVPSVARVRPTAQRAFEIAYRWEVGENLNQAYRAFVHFTSPRAQQAEQIVCQNDHDFARPTSTWRAGQTVEDGPFTVEVPPGWSGELDILIGVLLDGARQPLAELAGVNGRYRIGRLGVSDDGIDLLPPPKAESDRRCFARADNGWAERLCETDRFIKNTYEVLSALNRVTARLPMTQHEFIDDARTFEHTVFGDDVHVYANYGPNEAGVPGCRLPPFGFIVQSPTLVAFYAKGYNHVQYLEGAMFVAESQDGRPLADSERIRIYHAFGDDAIRLGGRTYRVRTETIVG